MKINDRQLEERRKHYPPGTRVELVFMDEDDAPEAGTMGTVLGMDDNGTLIIAWDDGKESGLAYAMSYARKMNEEK